MPFRSTGDPITYFFTAQKFAPPPLSYKGINQFLIIEHFSYFRIIKARQHDNWHAGAGLKDLPFIVPSGWQKNHHTGSAPPGSDLCRRPSHQ
jgi:hypothetical protein